MPAPVERQVSHLTRLVDDLLDVSRITSNKITLQKAPVELARVVTSAVEASRPIIVARRHTLEVRLPEEPLRVDGDLTRLSQIVVNLLNSAAKYTPEGGRDDRRQSREAGFDHHLVKPVDPGRLRELITAAPMPS